MPSYTGSKKAGRHSTLISDAVAVVDFARKFPEVSKISPGIIRPGGKRERMSIKVTEQTGCLLVTVHGKSSVQEVRIYCSQASLLSKRLHERFDHR